MVEHTLRLDGIFGSLADATRRDILVRLRRGPLNVSEVASAYDVSLAAVSKHLQALERARLVRKQRHGKERIVSLEPAAMRQAARYVKQYEYLWDQRLDRLEVLLQKETEGAP